MVTPETEAIRRKLERDSSEEPQVLICELHGERTTLVCVGCYAIQQERVERESLPLRMANTGEALRKRVLAELAKGNGHGGTGG